jgi:pimeloyl-ACP methyl ester carboxylesterase
MAKKKRTHMADHIKPLNMNGLRGRVLRLPAPKNKNRQILLVYGHHASIERMYGLAEELNRYGSVTLPDLPGFGGMQSLYQLGDKPDIDALADYLAAFVKMSYHRRRFTVVGMSFGFLVITRMLQKYPDIAKKVDNVVSIVGFAHHEDFHIKTRNKWLLKATGVTFSNRPMAIFGRYALLNGPLIRTVYRTVGDRNVKMRDANEHERDKRINFEIRLWQQNDVRTYAYTGRQMLNVDLCSGRQVKINLPVHHVKIDDDRYFDNRVVEQHLAIIYSDVIMLKTSLKGHAPTVVSSAKEAAPFIPRKLRTLLKQA